MPSPLVNTTPTKSESMLLVVSDASMITMEVMMTMMFRCCMVMVYGDGDDYNVDDSSGDDCGDH